MIRRLVGMLIEWFLAYPHTVYMQADSAYAEIPKHAYRGDAGYDLYTTEAVEVPPHGRALVPSGVRFKVPRGIWLLIQPRSSIMRRLGLHVIPAVIDNGYRGLMFVQVQNTTSEVVVIRSHERLGQVIPMRLIPLRFKGALLTHEELDTERSSKGFGSSGN